MTLQVRRRSRATTINDRPKEGGLTFITIQIFSLIYLQKFAIGPSSFQINIPMIIMLVSMIWMILSNKMNFRLGMVACFLLFIGLCLLSQIISGTSGSLPSLIYLAILYSFFIVSIDLSKLICLRMLNRFVKLMIFPAIIMILQYVIEKVTGQPDPINMNHLVPSSFLIQGFYYDAHYPWNSPFSRPNGFFFLEPSFASAFAASAAVIEITHFRRPLVIVLMLLGTFLSLGATGTTLLIVAAPFLLAREKPSVICAVVIAVIATLVAAYLLNIPIPLISRLDEFGNAESSGTGRLLAPAMDLLSLLSDPSFYFTGTGAGSTKDLVGSIWPIVKILREYGLVTMISFVIFYICGISGSFNLPLKVALSVIYHFTGEYLLSPVMVELVAITCFIVVPRQIQSSRLTILARHGSGATASFDGRGGPASRPRG